MRTRQILHCDMNNFYASVELLHRPTLRGKPVIVGGDEAARHGIVLAKNYVAKATGIKTGMTLREARQLCPNLVSVPPNFPLYLHYSNLAREIFKEYTDKVEPFGLDESWLDVTGDDGEAVATELRRRITHELGVTASVGVSYNKIFAKLGSDYKKPDATTVIRPDNFKEFVWPLPVEDLLYVGAATKIKLQKRNIMTIGDLARYEVSYLRPALGVLADVLNRSSNGYENSPVAPAGAENVIGSIGNGNTAPRNLVSEEDVKIMFYVLGESVAARMRSAGLRCWTVQIGIRDTALGRIERQTKLKYASCLSSELVDTAMLLLNKNHKWPNPLRSIEIRATDLVPDNAPHQLDLFRNFEKVEKLERLERTIEVLRGRFGHQCIQRAIVKGDRPLGSLNPQADNTIHPIGFFNGTGMV